MHFKVAALVMLGGHEYGCEFSCKKKIRKSAAQRRYGEWLALHQVLAGKLLYTIYILGTTINCQCCLSCGVVVTRTLERILFLDLALYSCN